MWLARPSRAPVAKFSLKDGLLMLISCVIVVLWFYGRTLLFRCMRKYLGVKYDVCNLVLNDVVKKERGICVYTVYICREREGERKFVQVCTKKWQKH